MSSPRIAVLSAATTALLLLPGGATAAVADSARAVQVRGADTAATRGAPASRPAKHNGWGAHVKLPDGSTARFGKDSKHPKVKITSGQGDDSSTTLDEKRHSDLHDGWLYELGDDDGPCLKVTDGGTGREWEFDFKGKLIEDSAMEHI
jgi:hypothetical protein